MQPEPQTKPPAKATAKAKVPEKKAPKQLTKLQKAGPLEDESASSSSEELAPAKLPPKAKAPAKKSAKPPSKAGNSKAEHLKRAREKAADR